MGREKIHPCQLHERFRLESCLDQNLQTTQKEVYNFDGYLIAKMIFSPADYFCLIKCQICNLCFGFPFYNKFVLYQFQLKTFRFLRQLSTCNFNFDEITYSSRFIRIRFGSNSSLLLESAPKLMINTPLRTILQLKSKLNPVFLE